MSARARRFFGCVLPLTLLIFGCAAFAMLGYAGQVVVQSVRVDDRAMWPILEPGWTVIINNTAFWAREPVRGAVISVGRPDSGFGRGLAFRRLYGLPGDTIEVRDGQVLIDDEPARVHDRSHGDGPDHGPVTLGDNEYFVLAEDRSYDDSRGWGPLERERLYGAALFYFPQGSRTIQTVDPTPTPVRESATSRSAPAGAGP